MKAVVFFAMVAGLVGLGGCAEAPDDPGQDTTPYQVTGDVTGLGSAQAYEDIDAAGCADLEAMRDGFLDDFAEAAEAGDTHKGMVATSYLEHTANRLIQLGCYDNQEESDDDG